MVLREKVREIFLALFEEYGKVASIDDSLTHSPCLPRALSAMFVPLWTVESPYLDYKKSEMRIQLWCSASDIYRID